jgi:hypothetical protein
VTDFGPTATHSKKSTLVCSYQLGPEGKDAAPTLRQLLRNEEEEIRTAAADALKKLDPGSAAEKVDPERPAGESAQGKQEAAGPSGNWAPTVLLSAGSLLILVTGCFLARRRRQRVLNTALGKGSPADRQ